ncbi:hypothetical protein Q0F98_23620 [Paenibacillus amylolyticus]|nr:hypothetical protein Q0F98_23620 [Paenibacillus amylolyticus]
MKQTVKRSSEQTAEKAQIQIVKTETPEVRFNINPGLLQAETGKGTGTTRQTRKG